MRHGFRGKQAQGESSRDRSHRDDPAAPPRGRLPRKPCRHQGKSHRHDALAYPFRQPNREEFAVLPVYRNDCEAPVGQHGDCRGRNGVSEHARYPAGDAVTEEFRGGQGEMFPFPRGDKTAYKCQPEGQLLDISGRAGDVEAAKQASDGINKREQGRQDKRTHERNLFKALGESI